MAQKEINMEVGHSRVLETHVAVEDFDSESGDLIHVNDFDFVKTLGSGSFATVKLARKQERRGMARARHCSANRSPSSGHTWHLRGLDF